jgi:hypothetical protein
MTKKDYIALANIIKKNTVETELAGQYSESNCYRLDLPVKQFMNDLCRLLKSDNPHFDEDKFRKACGC